MLVYMTAVKAFVGAVVGAQSAQPLTVWTVSPCAVCAGIGERCHLLATSLPSAETPLLNVIVCGWRVRLDINSSSRVSSRRTGRPVLMHKWPTMSRSTFPAWRQSRRRCGFDDAMRLTGRPKQRRNHAPHVEWNLRARAQRQPFVAVPIGDSDAGLIGHC